MITAIAGVNGAGKSSIVGSFLRERGGEYFNPDEYTRHLLSNNPILSEDEANGLAWQSGYQQLQDAVEQDHNYTFETTLGGNSICQLLHDAIDNNVQVRILYCGLHSPELHIQRVAQRVAKGGHHIPSEKIHARWQNSIRNMIGLIPRCQAVRVFDNSLPLQGRGPYQKPQPKCLFALTNGEFTITPTENIPDWAKPLAAAAIESVV